MDATAWPLLREAARRGYDARIGLEDTLRLPGGEPPGDNLDLVKAARVWISGVARESVSVTWDASARSPFCTRTRFTMSSRG